MECSDEELVAQCKAGGMGAFELLFRRYERRVFSVIARTIGNLEDAEDLKQEVFYRAYKSLGSFRGGCRFSTWVFRIAVNLCADHIKRRKFRALAVDELVEERSWEVVGQWAEDDPQDALEKRELRKAVQSAILALPPHYRVLIVLRHIDELSYEEIADVVGCSVNALNVRLHRAREAFRLMMKPYLTESPEVANGVPESKTQDNTAL